MPLLAGDMRFARSINMADVPEGGGPPSAQLLESGRSNDILPDISQESRTVGRVEIYQIFSVLRNTDRAALLGANVVLAEPPADPNVSVTVLSLKDPFATREQIARRIESGMSTGPEFGGYLLENHFATMRSIQVLQRPGMAPPAIGKTFVLVWDEGKPSERRQRVRIKATDTVVRTFTQIINGQLTDFQAQVTTCELFDGLAYDFPGSPPVRTFAREDNKTLIRETMYSDAGLFYSASRLARPCAATDVWLEAQSIYTQVVPNSRTEAASVDQQPAGLRQLRLADTPRLVEVGVTPHTQRIKVGEANLGLTYVAQLRPLPAPGLVSIDYWALGQRYTINDDGQGRLTGAGGGSVSYLSGALTLNLKATPDIGTSICITWGEPTAYTSRAAQGAAVRAPEYAWQIEAASDDEQLVPGSLTITWSSAGQLRTASDDGQGGLTGDASGVIDYPSRSVLLRPAFMPDASADFAVDCELDAVVTELLAAPAPDAAGFIQLSLQQRPAARSLSVQWATARTVSQTSGGQVDTVSANKSAGVTYTLRSVPEFYEPAGGSAGGVLPSGMNVRWSDPQYRPLHTD